MIVSDVDIKEIQSPTDVKWVASCILDRVLVLNNIEIHLKGDNVYVTYPVNITPISENIKSQLDEIITKTFGGQIPLNERA